MKWSWGWKWALGAFVFWLACVLTIINLGTFCRSRIGLASPLYSVVWRTRNALAGPAQMLVNWTWQQVGYLVPPKSPAGWQPDRTGTWLLRTPRITFRQPCEVRTPYRRSLAGPIAFRVSLTHNSFTPAWRDLALHLMLLPGLVVSLVVLVVGQAAELASSLLLGRRGAGKEQEV